MKIREINLDLIHSYSETECGIYFTYNNRKYFKNGHMLEYTVDSLILDFENPKEEIIIDFINIVIEKLHDKNFKNKDKIIDKIIEDLKE